MSEQAYIDAEYYTHAIAGSLARCKSAQDPDAELVC